MDAEDSCCQHSNKTNKNNHHSNKHVHVSTIIKTTTCQYINNNTHKQGEKQTNTSNKHKQTK